MIPFHWYYLFVPGIPVMVTIFVWFRRRRSTLGYSIQKLKRLDESEEKKRNDTLQKKQEQQLKIASEQGGIGKEGMEESYYYLTLGQCYEFWSNPDIMKTLSDKKKKSAKRLLTEFKHFVLNPEEGIGLAPENNKNIFCWRANISPVSGPLYHKVIHLIITFDEKYPDSGPTIQNTSSIRYGLFSGCSYNFSWSSNLSFVDILVNIRNSLSQIPKEIAANVVSVYRPEVRHMPPHQIWPRTVEKKGLVERMLSNQDESKLSNARKNLVCVYSNRNFEDDCMGIDIKFTKNIRTGDITAIHTTFTMLSLKAFVQYKVHKIHGKPFTHWLPIYINETHGKKASELAKRAISMICTGTTKKFDPTEQVLPVLTKLMNMIIIDTIQNKMPYTTTIRAYCYLHRLLLMFVELYPELTKQADGILTKFINDETFRHRENFPNIGIIQCLLAISDRYTWKDIRDAYFREALTRQVFWIFQKHRELNPDYIKQLKLQREKEKASTDDIIEVSNEIRVEMSFNASKVSFQSLMCHAFFLRNVARPQGVDRNYICKESDQNYGFPNEEIVKAWGEEYNYITGSSFKSFNNVFVAFEMETRDHNDIAKMLFEAIKESKEKGYHGKTIVALSSEEYMKQNRVQLDDFYVKSDDGKLIYDADERKWQTMCYEKFQVESLPTYLESVTEPWKHLYLQLHLQETIDFLNDTKDFDNLYKVIDEVKDYITIISIGLFNPTNLKSKYNFLTQIITRLKNLKTLIINKGAEKGINDKSFVAICKGLNNNKNIEQLEIEYCGLNVYAIDKLLKKELLANNNIKTIKLGGNMLLDDGSKKLATFLQSHETLNALTEMDLSDNRITDTGAAALAEAFLFKNNLKKLKLDHNRWRNIDEILIKLSYSPSIEELDISRSDNGTVSDKGISKLLANTKTLKSLNLWKSKRNTFGPNLMKALSENETLTVLDVAECNIDNTALENIGKALAKNTTLKEINLGSNSFNTGGIVSILEPQIQSKTVKLKDKQQLKGEGNLISDDEEDEDELYRFGESGKQKTTVTIMVKPSFSFQKLSLSNTKIYDPNSPIFSFANKKKPGTDTVTTDEDEEKIEKMKKHYSCIGELLIASEKLESIKLKSCNLNEDFMPSISNAIQSNTCNLKELILRQNNIGKIGVKNLHEGLVNTTCLQVLDLSGNKLGTAGGVLLAKSLESNTSLKRLVLYGNFLEADGTTAIIDALKANDKLQLQELDIGLNRIRNRGAQALISWIEESSPSISNFRLKTLHMKDNHISSAVAIRMAYALTKHAPANTSTKSKGKERQGSSSHAHEAGGFGFISMAGNFLSNEIKGELAKVFTQHGIQFDLAKVVEYKDEERQERTIYIPQLHVSITPEQLKKHFKKNNCGQIQNVFVHYYKKNSKNAKSANQKVKYAFVEFADQASVQIAMQLVFQKKNIINKNEFKVYRAGIVQKTN